GAVRRVAQLDAEGPRALEPRRVEQRNRDGPAEISPEVELAAGGTAVVRVDDGRGPVRHDGPVDRHSGALLVSRARAHRRPGRLTDAESGRAELECTGDVVVDDRQH